MGANREQHARAFQLQADTCARFGSDLYAGLMRAAAADLRVGGPLDAVLAGCDDDPGPAAIALRVFGAVHRIVLGGRAPALAAFYPTAGGTAPADADTAARAWDAFRAVLAAHGAEIAGALGRAPQTNEPGRSAVLLGALLHVLSRLSRPLPVRLWEIGASAGLNLRADHACITDETVVTWGDERSPFRLDDAWHGALPPLYPLLDLVERRGCDVAPVDPTTPAGRTELLSYVWPDSQGRVARLDGALAVATRIPATVEPAGAGEFIERLQPEPGTLTVVWHSIVWQYLGAGERRRCEQAIASLGAAACPDGPVARVTFEPESGMSDGNTRFLVTVTRWPGARTVVLGEAHPHGLPVTWW